MELESLQKKWQDKYDAMAKRYERAADIDSDELKVLLDIGDNISRLERHLDKLTPKSQKIHNDSPIDIMLNIMR